MHRQLGQFGRAEMMAHRANQEAEACQADVWVHTPRRGLGNAEGAKDQPAGTGLLSEAEQRVAAPAALGHNNREIGRTLYVTLSTVERHLTRVYRKLNVRGRKDLPAALSIHSLPPIAETPSASLPRLGS
ncbi:LuxR C-terminal-related transcriptional regulator [Streptomyces sp. NPDC052101]|uniref:response regulator transcription factor n=1 Tax=Streptomyces sp. NPDC052101 TaxID=3155763 RepID=UPI003432050B